MKTLVFIFALCSSLAAQTFHVTGVHNWTVNDPAPASRSFKTVVIVGTLDGKTLTTEQLFSWGSQRFEVGADYAVTKQTDRALTVTMHDKHNSKERLDIVGVEEK